MASIGAMLWIESSLAALVLALALALKPWRSLGAGGPPWPWLAWWAVMPLLWGADRYAHVSIIQPLSGAALLVLLAGWPLAMLAMPAVAAVVWAAGGLDLAPALERLVWLGMLPGTLAFVAGQGIRRCLPHQVFVYILGRGFFATLLATSVTGGLALWMLGVPPGSQGEDVMIGRWLSAWADAFLCGMFAAIFVALRPEWLATYSDQLYLPERSPPP